MTMLEPAQGAPRVEGAAEGSPNIVERFWQHVASSPERTALRHVVDGEWAPVTWAAYGEEVAAVAAGLVALGVEPGDRVGVLGGNSVRWHESDLGTLSAAAVTVPVYATNVASQVAYVLGHAGAKVCFVADRDQLAKVLLRRHALPDLVHVIVFEPVSDGLDDPFVMGFDELLEVGRERLVHEPDVVVARRAALEPDSVATLVYTSGTTGPPKGTVLTHHNLGFTIASVTSIVEVGPDDRFLSFLPLSHIAERVVSDFGQIVSGGETWFARSLTTVPEDLQACRPTIFFAVPRVWQKFHEAILTQLDEGPRPLQAAFERYVSLGLDLHAPRTGSVGARVAHHAEYAALDHTVGALLRHKLGLDRAHFLVSAAAPIHEDLLRWFEAIGLPIAEVYGQTEDCGPTTANRPGRIRLGTVGEPLPGVEVRIADDGEVLVRGDNVCAGYYENATASKELVDEAGWMHSGDLGQLEDGYLRITGRKKDLIINAAGKNIAPQELETHLESHLLISQAVVVGEGRSYLVALLTLDAEQLHHWADAHHKLLAPEALVDDDELRAAVAEAVDDVNQRHAPVERIKRWKILPRDFTVATGELTPTLKVKRDVVNARYADLIDELYATPA